MISDDRRPTIDDQTRNATAHPNSFLWLTLAARHIYNQSGNNMASSNISLIIPLVDAERSRKTGGKAVNLSKLIAARFAVPRGFVISVDGYRSHLWASGARVAASCVDDPASREAVRSAILSADIPDDVWQAVAGAYHRLSLQLGFENPEVAVRPSALDGDSSDAYEHRLGVSGVEALKTALKEVWASAWTGQSVERRSGMGLEGEPAMAVIVQQMMDTRRSGTVWTADPSTGDPRRARVDCVFPSGTHRFTVDLRELAVVEYGGSGQERPDDPSMVRLAEKAVLMESVVASPVEVDWVYEQDRVWIISAGPVRGLPCRVVEGADGCEWKRISSAPVSHLSRGILWTAERDGSGPFPSVRVLRIIDGYVCSCSSRDSSHDPKSDLAAGRKLLSRWNREVYPALTSVSSANIGADLASLPYSQLLSRFAGVAESLRTAAEWLERMCYPRERFTSLLREVLGSVTEDEVAYGRLIGGIYCPAFMRDARLQDFGERFRLAELSGSVEEKSWRRDYRHEVRRFAEEYGYSFGSRAEMCDPASWRSWVEDHDAVFHTAGALARGGSRLSLVTLHCAAAEDAKRAESEVSAVIRPELRGYFSGVLHAARGWLAASDECEHAYALLCTALRLMASELARRFTESGVISAPEDIWHLSVDEALAIPAEASSVDRAMVAADIARRKHEMWLEGRLAAREAWGEGCATDCDLKGAGASPGRATGRVRLARDIAGAWQIEPGDILVVESLGPAWTPFLGVAGGVVSELGFYERDGERALVCDYGVPVVSGCRGIAGVVKDGRRITVDGTAGTVSLS